MTNYKKKVVQYMKRNPYLKRVLSKGNSMLKNKNIFNGVYAKALIDKGFYLSISPEALLTQEYCNKQFCRYDVIVRYIAVEKYLNGESDPFNLYNKMQSKRNVTKNYEENFTELINTIKSNGFNFDSSIVIGKDGHLIDGSHRLAISLFFKIPLLTCKMNPLHSGVVDYGLEWFKKNGFNDQDIKNILNSKDLIFWENGLYFPLILWPSVLPYFDEIINKINKSYDVKKINKYSFEEKEFYNFVRSIYAIDDIESWKINKKINGLANYKKEIIVMWIEFTNPMYRKKKLNNSYISTAGEDLKLQIRNSYKKKIKNYFYDIICHTGDNHLHNKSIFNILKELHEENIELM